MDSENNRNANLNKLSGTAQRMLELRDPIFSEWEKRVRATVDAARTLPHPLLINTLPVYFENLVQAISSDAPRRIATDTNTFAVEHGSERARLTEYSPQSVIDEFQILRWTILDVLSRHAVVLNAEELYTLNASIDSSVRESATAYALAQSALRERFVAALAHDLRSPLNNIVSAAELMLRLNDVEKIKALAKKVIDNGVRIDSMTKDMLDCMKLQRGERLVLNLSQFDVLETAKEVCEQSHANGDTRIELAGKSIIGWWDRDAIRRVIENLIGNALKYGASTTPVRIAINAQHGRMIITVHNMGEPVPPEQVESIFQVFRRAETAMSGKRQGWGIGLPYVRSVAESHGGSVVVDSSAETGTTFAVDIPVDARPFQNKPTLGA
jgi:signal transduction histidine kinase